MDKKTRKWMIESYTTDFLAANPDLTPESPTFQFYLDRYKALLKGD